MPYLEWKDSLSVGIRNIDEQHRQLVDMVNELHDEAETSGRHCPAPELVARLKAYAAEHFHIEEGYMQAFAYPDFEAHRLEHEGFLSAIHGFEAACTAGQADPREVLEFLKQWLVQHITDVDVQMGRFLEDYLQ